MKITNLKQLSGYRTAFTSKCIAVCTLTGKGYFDYENKSGILTKVFNRLKTEKSIEESFEIVSNPFYMKSPEQTVECKICAEKFKTNRGGDLTRHLRDKHNISAETYLLQYPDQKQNFKSTNKQLERENKLKKSSVCCPVCGKRLGSITISHIAKHGYTSMEIFRKKYNLSTVVSGKVRQDLVERFADRLRNGISLQSNHSEPERKVQNALSSKTTYVGGREFDAMVDRTLIEVDGEFWHPATVVDILPVQVRNLANDIVKENIAKDKKLELIRVRVNDIPENITIENLRKVNKNPCKNGRNQI